MTTMKSLCHRIVLFSCAVLGATCSSSSDGGNKPLDQNAFGAKYKLTDNAIDGWKQDTAAGAFATFDQTTIFNKIDGAAPQYLDRGMRLAMYQQLIGPDPQNCTLIVMDMVSETNAKTMVSFQQTDKSASLTIPGYDSSVAIASETLTGITVYAYAKALYLEVILDGYGSDHEPARAVAAKFLAAEAAKAQ